MTVGLHWPDWLMLLILLGSVVIGMMRGVVFEILSIVSWVVAWVAASMWAEPAGMWLGLGDASSALPRTIGFGAVFVLALIVCRLLTWLVRQVIHATPLAMLDRLFGFFFGVLRGGLIVLAAVLLVGATPLARHEGWLQSSGVHWARSVLAVVAPVEASGSDARDSTAPI